MSYILDALRRADAERERGRVPGLHTQVPPSRTTEPPAARGARPSRGPLWIGLGVLAAAIAGIAWWLMRDGASAPPPGPVTQAPSSAPAFQPEPPPAPPPRMGVAPAPAPAAPVQPILAPPPPPPPPAPSAAPVRPPTPPVPPPPVTPAPTPAPTVSGDTHLPRVNELGPAARAALPPLKLSGSTYADNPKLRMLIVDGQVVQEGQDIVPGLKLESIGPRSAVIVHQGQRLRLPY